MQAARHLLALGSFNAFAALMSGLTHTAVVRVAPAWTVLLADYGGAWDELLKVRSSLSRQSFDYKPYAVVAPCVYAFQLAAVRDAEHAPQTVVAFLTAQARCTFGLELFDSARALFTTRVQSRFCCFWCMCVCLVLTGVCDVATPSRRTRPWHGVARFVCRTRVGWRDGHFSTLVEQLCTGAASGATATVSQCTRLGSRLCQVTNPQFWSLCFRRSVDAVECVSSETWPYWASCGG